VEGWRGLSHSFSMVNQHQLLALQGLPGVQLFHRDLPFFRPGWNPDVLGDGFERAERARLDAIAQPDGAAVDAVYRIAFPAPAPVPTAGPAGSHAARQLTFIVTEYGLRPLCIATPVHDMSAYTRDGNRIVAPSNWARERIVDFGFQAERVCVIPHGVQRQTFRPYADDERRARRQGLGFEDEDFVFANVGVASWNKGLDHLLVAFARLFRQMPQARLLLKNNRAMYGATVNAMVEVVSQVYPGLLSEAVMDAIFVVDANLDQAGLRELYACADCYVSPYRAEGFNLPVLEAMACGTPVVVTAGGATDDYCRSPWASRVDSRPSVSPDSVMVGGRCLEIDADGLLQAMLDRLHAPADQRRLSGPAWDAMLDGLSWTGVAQRLLALCAPVQVCA
jgi:glycosyltransferase involved in cell wall biosynthesis